MMRGCQQRNKTGEQLCQIASGGSGAPALADMWLSAWTARARGGGKRTVALAQDRGCNHRPKVATWGAEQRGVEASARVVSVLAAA